MFKSPFSIENGFSFRIICVIFVVLYAVPLAGVAFSNVKTNIMLQHMNTKLSKIFAIFGRVSLFAMNAPAQSLTEEQTARIQEVVASRLPAHMGIGSLKVRSAVVDNGTINVDLSENFGDVPFTVASIEQLKKDIGQSLGTPYLNYDVKLMIAGADINNYFANFENSYKRSHAPFITELDPTRQERARRQHHRRVAQPWLVLRAVAQPVGMAACPYVPDGGRHVHPQLCDSLLDAHA